MGARKYGCQTPTKSVVLPYSKSKGKEAVKLYNRTTRKARKWQALLVGDILAVNPDGLWAHTRFGYEVPRRNGKGEVIIMRELFGLDNGERIMHTAHRVTTSHSAWERIDSLLSEAGIEHTATKQMGLETITLPNGGKIAFRTRSNKGGVGEGYDTLIIDEAQEYTIDQESALKYVVSDSSNPQTIFCGTPPTATSSGTVFVKFREKTLQGGAENCGWAEWSIEDQVDPHEKSFWYDTNPSLGYGLTERAITDEITSDDLDFNIQRLGYWATYNQKSAITEDEWKSLEVEGKPTLKGRLFVGIKYGRDGSYVSMSVAVRTKDGRIFVECVDCQSTRNGNAWMTAFIKRSDIEKIVVDGAGQQQLLMEAMAEAGIRKKPILPTVKEVIVANAGFEQALYARTLCHASQPSLETVVTNCDKRDIGSNGGFGYRCMLDDMDVSLMDSVILAHWICSETKEKRKRKRIHY